MTEMTIRPYHGGDESGLLAVWQAALSADPITPHIFHTRVLLDPNFKAENLLVAENSDQVRGFVLGMARQVPHFLEGLEPGSAWVTAFGVQPGWERQGIGARLFEQLEAQFYAEGREVIQISPYVPNYFTPGVDTGAYPGALAFLQARGYRVIDRPVSMQMPLTTFRIPETLTALEQQWAGLGYSFQPVRSSDLPDLLPFIAYHFGWEWWRHAQEYLQELFNGSDEISFWVARRSGQVAGYCQMRRERFGPFGVDPALRNQGIGQVLLSRCLADQRSKGFHTAWFLWAEEAVARLYERAGFQIVRRWAIFEKRLG